MSNKLPDITITLRNGTMTLAAGGTLRQVGCFMPCDDRAARTLIERMRTNAALAWRLWQAAVPVVWYGRTFQADMADVLRVIESEPVPPEPLAPTAVETVEDDPEYDESSRWCSVCGRTRPLCDRNPVCVGARKLATRFPPSLSGQGRRAWYDWVLRGIEHLREHPLSKLWLIATGGVPAVVDAIDADDDLVVVL